MSGASKIGIVIQARSGSTRFPKKILENIASQPVLTRVLQQCKKVKNISQIVVATTTQAEDDLIEKLAKSLGVEVFRGSVNDVLSRYAESARKYDLDWTVRVTSDCPLLDPQLVDQLIEKAIQEDLDFVSISTKPGGEIARSFPHGLDAEVYKSSALYTSDQEAKEDLEREHVGVFITKNAKRFKIGIIENPENLSFIRLTLDYPEDLERLNFIRNKVGENFRWPQIVELIKKERPPIFFAVDSDKSSGKGHITRSQSLARALMKKKQDCVFITQDPNSILPLFEPLKLSGVSDQEKAEQVARLMKSVNAKLLVLDSYLLGNSFYQALKQEHPDAKIIAFDDAGEKESFEVDQLICLYRQDSYKECLAQGIGFFPLRDELLNIASKADQKTIMVCMGGADSDGWTEKVGDFLLQMKESIKSWKLQLVYGPNTAIKKEWPSSVQVLQDPKNFVELLANCSLAIISGGNLAWEALALAKTSVIIQTANNQAASIQLIKDHKAAITIRDAENISGLEIEKLLNDENYRSQLRQNAAALIDGKGAERLASAIVAYLTKVG